MTAHTNLERRVAEHYASEPPLRAPDRVLHGALATIETTPQRRGLFAPWRFAQMNTYAKLAAAVAVVVVVAFGVWQLVPGSGPGGPGATPSPSPSPTPAATTYVAPPLTGTFTSTQYGYSLSYPEGWSTGAATELWRDGVLPEFGNAATDTVYDPKLMDHLFVGAASQPLNGATLDEWQGEFFGSEECGVYEQVVVDGADGFIGADCDIAMVQAGGRGYIFGLWSSSDDRELRDFDTRALFQAVLATVQLEPGAAIE